MLVYIRNRRLEQLGQLHLRQPDIAVDLPQGDLRQPVLRLIENQLALRVALRRFLAHMA